MQTGVRIEKRMLQVLKALAELFEISLGDLVEGIVLHAFEGQLPFDEEAQLNATFGAMQWPAFAATTSLLVSKKNLGRANGLVQFGEAASEILAPALAGATFLPGLA